MQRSLCGRTWDKYPNCDRNHVAFSNRCTKITHAAKEAQQCRVILPAGGTFANTATDIAPRINRVVLGHRVKGTANEGIGVENKV
jgi:hypothetical protein